MTPLRTWIASRVAVALLVYVAGVQLIADRSQHFFDLVDNWDVTQFVAVARFGYTGHHDPNSVAFLPGFPVVMRLVHAVVPSWTAAGLLVSFVAGAVGVVYLAKLAGLEGVDGSRAVLYLVLSPYAVFLFVGYSEALFLALALPGWYAARRGNWAAASLLVAAATTVRVSGVFLALGLVVEFAVTSRDMRVAPWLLSPFVAAFGYVVYLHHLTGDWLRWQHAQAAGWDRHLTNPITAFRTTLDSARSSDLPLEYVWSFRAEIVSVAVGLLLTLVLVRRREWGQATYIGLSVGALASSTFYLSVARATLLWFPLWILLAELASKRTWLHTAFLTVSPALMAVSVLTFADSRWVG